MLEDALVKEIVPYVDKELSRAGRAGEPLHRRAIGGQRANAASRVAPSGPVRVGVGFCVGDPVAGEHVSDYVRPPDSPTRRSRIARSIQLRCGTKDRLLDASGASDKSLPAHEIRREYKGTDYESMWPGRRDDHTWPIR